MPEEPQEATRRVVKKVVKKTVVRPPTRSAAPPPVPPAGTRAPTARLATPRSVQATRPASPPPTPTSLPPELRAQPPTTAPLPAAPRPRRRLPRPHLPAFDLGGRLSDARYAVTDRLSDARFAVRDAIADAWHWLIGLRLPHLSPMRGSAVTGVLVGLLAVVIGWGFLSLFSATLGTRAGGGWGFLALVLLSFIAFISGELLLSGFGVPLARVISMLSVLLILLMVLVFFIRLAAGVWAWLLLPVLGAGSFAASAVIMRITAQEQNPQRLPWEPTDESQINPN